MSGIVGTQNVALTGTIDFGYPSMTSEHPGPIANVNLTNASSMDSSSGQLVTS